MGSIHRVRVDENDGMAALTSVGQDVVISDDPLVTAEKIAALQRIGR